MGRADGPARREGKRVQLIRHRPQAGGVERRLQVEERPHHDLAGHRADQERRCRVVPAKYVLHARQEVRQMIGGDGHVLHELDRLRGPAQGVQLGQSRQAELP